MPPALTESEQMHQSGQKPRYCHHPQTFGNALSNLGAEPGILCIRAENY